MTHTELAQDIDALAKQGKSAEKLGLELESVDTIYDPIIQSGGEYVVNGCQQLSTVVRCVSWYLS